ncbi:MAG: PIN domain-containing protein [Sulfurimonadaceae bacterium]
MQKYLVDSDVLIYFLKGKPEAVAKLSQLCSESLFTSRINYTELLYGAYNSARVEQNLHTILPFLSNFQILEFDAQSALCFAKLKAALKKSGTIIADMDLMIASIAIENNCTLLTNNLKHFERISELRVVGLEG